MFVRYSPLPFDLAQADGQAEVQVCLLPVGSRSGATHGRDDKGNIRSGSDTHIRNVKMTRNR